MPGESSQDGAPTEESLPIEDTDTTLLDRVYRWFAGYFGFEEHGTDLQTEIIAGVTTFLTMSYIIVVNPALLAGVPDGKPGIVMADHTPAEVRQMLAVTTILAATVAIFVMAFHANRPFAQAPGLGLNAFFAFTVVGTLGISWQTGLAAVVTEGVLFMALTAIGARKYVVELFPKPVKLSVGTGIGLFLTLALYAKRIGGAIIIGTLTTTLIGMVVTLLGVLEPGVVAAGPSRRVTVAGRTTRGIRL